MWSVSELEMAGILYALESNLHYFIGKKFRVYTEHIIFRRTGTKIEALTRKIVSLQNYQFEIFINSLKCPLTSLVVLYIK